MAIKKTTKSTKSTNKTKGKTEEKPLIAPNDTLKIVIPWSDLEPEYNKAVTKMAKSIKADGFRKGKVPHQLVEERVGTEKILEQAVEQLLSEAYTKAVKAADKHPVTQPEFRPLKFAKGNDVELEAQIAEKPEVKVTGYKKVADKAKKEADKKLKDQEKAEKTSKSKKDDKKDKHPSAKPLTAEQKEDYRLQVIYQALVQEFKPAIPELIVKQEVRADLDQLVKQLESMQMKLDDYLARRQLTFEQLSQELTMGALGRIQVVFILDSIAASAKLDVSDKEITEYIDKNVPAEARKTYQDHPQYKAVIRQTLLRKKVADHLLAK